ncbi:MBL fold metallo-hydrolase [Xylanimonas protaetiae]|uniref:MBL fold metallo-hydrolase n=1 Tax=Xylanimonas protaetiae TaxID=2509457 RepID=UPI001A9382B3|nr:MBL fold metallo-hydrolase [Xylanimonas protaetiae]
MRLTHLGGPTVLVELDGWRILTDPTFDPPGRTYGFGLGTSSTKVAGPALEPEQLGPVDVVLLSHDHHADNLDDRGRALLPSATTVLTTASGRDRLGAPNVRGLRPGETVTLAGDGRPPLHVRATPCRHGPPLSRPVAGDVVGFALTPGDGDRVALWMTGDTVLHAPVRRLARRRDVDVLLMHLGRVRFPVTGPLRYSMDGRDAVRLVRLAAPRVAVPVHYEGWSHFSEPAERLRAALTGAPVRWLEPGTPSEV